MLTDGVFGIQSDFLRDVKGMQTLLGSVYMRLPLTVTAVVVDGAPP